LLSMFFATSLAPNAKQPTAMTPKSTSTPTTISPIFRQPAPCFTTTCGCCCQPPGGGPACAGCCQLPGGGGADPVGGGGAPGFGIAPGSLAGPLFHPSSAILLPLIRVPLPRLMRQR